MHKLFFLVALVCGKKYTTKDSNVTYPHNFISFNKTLLQSIKTVDTPSRFDWREKANVPIKNQGHCGSCWAFATVSPIEYQYTYKSGRPIRISEQSLISCNSHKYSCEKGGWWDYDDLIKNGVILEDDFPYDGIDESCKNVKATNKIKVLKWGSSGNGIEQIKSAIFQYGPVATGVSVDSEFYNYINGIYDHNSMADVNHAVVLVGWDDDIRSWILRNSWGEKWGTNGYMYIEYGVSYIATESAYVIIDINEIKKYTNVFGY